MSFINKAYKATVTCTMLVSGDELEPLNIEEYLKTVRVEKNYFDASFPVYTFELSVTADIYQIVQEEDVTFNLNVITRNINEDEDEEERTLIDELLLPFEKPSIPVNYENPEENINEDETLGSSVPQYSLTIHMLSKKDYDKNKAIINEVFSDIRPKEALINLISRSITDTSKEIFIEPIDNQQRYRNIIIPPMNLIPAVNYIQQIYGVYKNGIKLFIDSGNTYLLRQNGLLTLSDPLRETINIIFTTDATLSSEYNNISGLRMDNIDDIIEIVTTSDPSVLNSSDTNNQIAGENIIFGRYSELFDQSRILKQSTNDDNSNNLKTKYYWNNFGSSIFEDEFVNDVNQTSVTLSFIWNEIDPYFFNIMNTYTINTSLDSLNGVYRIHYLAYSLTGAGSDNDFNIVGNSVFSKVA